ncbi:hypothetical protein K8B33_04025 [Alcanivorax sp. JB21]|uniref:hypothetical protein n=1 Tax=Alcanivorax limicola TaxID=2874102 RepID=UPI001CBCBC86|nr:hypothetical protein [Alcanivorax limicola]MBZ2188249.1 hypothetical protein [Alcanivorax limicola]
MKRLTQSILLAVISLLLASTGMADAPAPVDPTAQQLASEIRTLEEQLLIKKAEYQEHISNQKLLENDDVRMRGRSSASQCSYQCNLRHRDDHYMWSQCFRACTR